MAFLDVTIKDVLKAKRGNSRLTKAYCAKHKGKYPVYTGQTNGPMEFIDTYAETDPSISYATDGVYAGTTCYISDEKYTIGGHRAKITLKSEKLYDKYIMYVLQPVLISEKKNGDVPSVIWKDVSNKTIPIPIQLNGQYDYDEQKRLASRYELIDEKKAQIQDKVDEVINTVPIIKSEGMVDVKIGEILDFDQATNNSSFTKKFINKHSGNIPVYGASKEMDIPSYGYVADNVDGVKYFHDCLTYNMDGLAGRIFYREGKFTLSEKVIPLPVFEKLKDQVDVKYIKYVAEPLFIANRKGRIGEKGKNEYSKLHKSVARNICIPMPKKPDGTFDIDKQKEIATKYEKMYLLKDELKKKVDRIMTTAVIID